MKPNELTIHHAQRNQPWIVPYSGGVLVTSVRSVPHILASHCVLHAVKSVGKLATVFEAADHGKDVDIDTVKAMAADLVTAALRFANLYQFNLAEILVDRVEEKNGVNILEEQK